MNKIITMVLLSIVIPRSLFGFPLIKGLNKVTVLEDRDTVLVAAAVKNVYSISDFERIEKKLTAFYENKYPEKNVVVCFDLEVYSKVKAYNEGSLPDKGSIIELARKRNNR